MKKILTFLFVLTAVVANAQIQERYVKAVETLETGVNFIYRGIDIPVLDITYHEFSADSLTWRKDFQEGDCYVRFTNEVDNSTDHHPEASWWVFNFCTCNGAIQPGGGTLDTLYVVYNNNDTVTYIDTVVLATNLEIKIPQPDTITGSTINYQDTSGHTHALYIEINDNIDVDATPTDGQVLKWNDILQQWVAANDLIGGGGASLRVMEQDGTPTVNNVVEIKVENGTVTNNGVGSVSIDFMQEAVNLPQDFYRAGVDTLTEGDNFVSFTTPFTDNDYILVSLHALYADSTRQNLVSDSLALDGFRVIGVAENAAYVSYLAIRDIDSLGLAAENQGKVLASGTDTVMSYLNGAVDDTTITITNETLHALVGPDTLAYYVREDELPDTTINAALGVVYVDSLNVRSIKYADTYWDDMSIPLIASAAGAAAPDLAAFRGSGIMQRAFDGAATDETMYVEGQFSHRIKDSSIVFPHYHISPSTTPVATDTVVLQFEYIWESVGDVFPASATITTEIPIGGIAQWEHAMIPMSSSIAAIGNQESAILIGRVTRLQSNVSDTYTGDLFIFTLDLHYESDEPGSHDISPY